jgi:hypothetical protein
MLNFQHGAANTMLKFQLGAANAVPNFQFEMQCQNFNLARQMQRKIFNFSLQMQCQSFKLALQMFVCFLLSQLVGNKATGLDKISSKVVKIAASVISDSLTYIFNQSIILCIHYQMNGKLQE